MDGNRKTEQSARKTSGYSSAWRKPGVVFFFCVLRKFFADGRDKLKNRVDIKIEKAAHEARPMKRSERNDY
jgi:hypothetical protein